MVSIELVAFTKMQEGNFVEFLVAHGASLTPHTPHDGAARQQGEHGAEEEARDMGPPSVAAVTRAHITEDQLQNRPDADQQEGWHTHEFQIKPKRQDQSQTRARK